MIYKILDTVMFAVAKHGKQVQRFGNEPYINHCIRVAALVEGNYSTNELVQAALLHDVLEDTLCELSELQANFSDNVVQWVYELTDATAMPGINRAQRKANDRDRLFHASFEAKAIKCADIMDNLPSIVAHDRGFGKVMLAEVKLLLPLLEKTHYHLYKGACEVMAATEAELAKGETNGV